MEGQVEFPLTMAPPPGPPPSHGQSPSSSPSPDGNGSTSSPASSSSSIPITTFINASHYQMLMTGDIQALQGDLLSQRILRLSDLATELDNSSALHIAAAMGNVNLINFIISQSNNDHESRQQNLLVRPNNKGDLPIHVATRAGKKDAAETLVAAGLRCEMLEMVNQDDNTSLHIALENQQNGMAEMLFENCPHTFYRMNKEGISPLYFAIMAGFKRLAASMLQTKLEDLEDPRDVERQLREAKVVYAAIMAKDLATLSMVVSHYRDLILKSCDEKGRRPLSYAAYTGFLEGVKCLLNEENLRNIAFRPDDDGDFPIHWACRGGNIQVVKAFLNHSSHLMGSLNQKQQSILHVAAESGKAKVVNHILGLRNSDGLVNMKDKDGNTPLHLAANGKHPRVVYALTWDARVWLNLQNKKCMTALDIAGEDYGQVPSFQERLTWLALRYAGVPRSPTHGRTILTIPSQPPPQDNKGTSHGIFTAQAITMNHAYHPFQASEPTPTNKYKERLNTLLMVSTLVATVTYASGFAVPGGYKQDDDNHDIGMAVLAKRAAFRVFVISDTVALFCSILAVVILVWAHLDDVRLILLALDFAIPLLGISLVMMCVAFMAGLYVTLQTQPWVGISVLVMGSVLLGAVLVFFVPLYSPTSRIRFKVLRYVFHVPFTLMLLACEMGPSETLY